MPKGNASTAAARLWIKENGEIGLQPELVETSKALDDMDKIVAKALKIEPVWVKRHGTTVPEAKNAILAAMHKMPASKAKEIGAQQAAPVIEEILALKFDAGNTAVWLDHDASVYEHRAKKAVNEFARNVLLGKAEALRQAMQQTGEAEHVNGD